MANKLIFIVAPKVFTYGECIKLAPGQTYTDIIYKDLNYTGVTPKFVTVVNTCNKEFTVPATTLFTYNGFTASIADTVVPANQTVNIPVIYNGTYTGNAPETLRGTISINGSTANYEVTVKLQDRPPVTQDNTINLNNREDAIVTSVNLIYSDPDDDPVTNVRFTGDVSRLFTDPGRTVPYVAGTELPISFTLYFKAPDQDPEYRYEVTYAVKANGVWSQ